MTRSHLILAAVVAAALAAIGFVWLGSSPTPDTPGRNGQGPGPDGPLTGTGNGSPGPEVPEGPPPIPPGDRAHRLVREIMDAEGPGDRFGDPRIDEAVNDPGVAKALRELVKSSAPDEERSVALLLLGQSRIEESRETLLAAANGNLGPEMRIAAILAFSRADSDYFAELLKDVAIRERDPEVALAAMQTLLAMDPQGSLATLDEVLDRSGKDAARRSLFWGLLGRSPGEPAEGDGGILAEYRRSIPSFFEHDPDPPPEMAEAIRKLGERAAKETDGEVALQAAGALLRLPGKAAATALGKLWDGAGDDVRISIVSRFRPGPPDGKLVEIVKRAPKSKNREMRRMVSLLLEIAPDPAALPGLRTWLEKEKDPEIRERLEASIRRLGQPR